MKDMNEAVFWCIVSSCFAHIGRELMKNHGPQGRAFNGSCTKKHVNQNQYPFTYLNSLTQVKELDSKKSIMVQGLL